MGKNLLSDTDFTKGWDNRFGISVCVGKVTQIECSDKAANVRVKMPDRVDHEGQPLITKPVPVLQVASQAKKSFAIPRLNTNVLMVKLPNGTSNYLVVGSFYTSKDPPPVSDPMLDYVEYDDGSTMQFNASTGELTWKIKGDCLVENEKSFTFKLKQEFKVDTDGKVEILTDGNVTIKPQGKAIIEAAGGIDIKATGQLLLQGTTIKMMGPIDATGAHETHGIHHDTKGFHTNTEREEELLARVNRLEILLGAMDQRLANLEAHHGV